MSQTKRSPNLGSQFMNEEADKIKTVGSIVYKGYCAPGTTGTDEAKWSIVKIDQTDPLEIGYTYANGMFEYDQVWDDVLTLDYTFRKF